MSNEADDLNVGINKPEEVEDAMESLRVDYDENEMSGDNFLGTDRLMGTDSENETSKGLDAQDIVTKSEKKAGTTLEAGIESVNEERPNVDIRKKTRMLIDSDSEDSYEQMAMKRKQKLSHLVDSDIGQEHKCEFSNLVNKNTNKSKTIDTTDTDSEDEPQKTKSLNLNKKITGLIDTDSETGAENSNEENNADEQQNKHRTKPPKKIRAAAQKAMDEMQTIQSEQQRLHREAHISIPYHKPKRYTLHEFLKRRTICKPSLENAGSPAAVVVQSKSLKMTPEELEKYAKLMDERAKEATEFFKSESESEEELKDNENVLEYDPETIENAVTDEIFQTVTSENAIDLPLYDDVSSTSKAITTDCDDAVILTTQPIITDVIELPKLDTHNINCSPMSTSIAAQNTRTSESLKRLITEKHLPDSPSLKGDANMLIDLETGDLIAKQPTGADNLLRRLLATNKVQKIKTAETLNILSTENDKIELSKVNINRKDEPVTNNEHKPGAAYLKLKENLKNIIKKKRLEDIQKKQEEEIEYNKCLEGDDEDYEYEPEAKPKRSTTADIIVDDEENALAEDEDGELALADDTSFRKTDDIDASSEDENQSVIDINNEDIVDDAEESSEEEGEGEEINGLESTDKSKPKRRIIQAFQDSDDEIDLLKSQFPTPTPNTAALIALDSNTSLCVPKNSVGGLPFISQIPFTQFDNDAQSNTDELMELCSGTFDTNTQSQTAAIVEQTLVTQLALPTQTKCNKILSSNSENENSMEASNAATQKRNKKYTKKMKKNKRKLGFSDDEEDETACNVSDIDMPDGDVADEPATFIDYDSEENEIVVQMTKKDCLKQAEKYFENEAELSESEWGSADEDEKNMDKYDIELGDEDEFDREKLRTELGQIHARKMLDEDIKKVRKIQELFFEDEEMDGVGRQRQFKWKNAESGFSLDDTQREENGNDENGECGDEENEHMWRKIRYERKQLLMEQRSKQDSPLTTSVNDAAHETLTDGTVNKKLNIITARNTTAIENKKSSPFLISKGIAVQKTLRGSFLVRDKETLSKLAGLTKGGISINDDKAATVSVKTLKATNFVFATLTEEEHETLKRKADDLLNSSTENGINFMKKPKVGPRRDKCLIDQLL